jgi:hypothetical protein
MARKATDTTRRAREAVPAPSANVAAPPSNGGRAGGVRPWHLLLVATLVAVAAGIVVTRGTSSANSIAVAVAIATAALAAAAAARTVAPLVSPELGEQAEMLGGRTRAALERDKMLVLRSIKEVEFDRAMKKISDADFQEMSGRLRSRAAGLMRQLDQDASGYRGLIERELETRVGPSPLPGTSGTVQAPPPALAAGQCPACGASGDADARFCKACGTRIGVDS